jgi:hypothetical protein
LIAVRVFRRKTTLNLLTVKRHHKCFGPMRKTPNATDVPFGNASMPIENTTLEEKNP